MSREGLERVMYGSNASFRAGSATVNNKNNFKCHIYLDFKVVKQIVEKKLQVVHTPMGYF